MAVHIRQPVKMQGKPARHDDRLLPEGIFQIQVAAKVSASLKNGDACTHIYLFPKRRKRFFLSIGSFHLPSADRFSMDPFSVDTFSLDAFMIPVSAGTNKLTVFQITGRIHFRAAFREAAPCGQRAAGEP